VATSSTAKELSLSESSVLVILAVEAVHLMAYVPAALSLLQQSKPAIVRLVQLLDLGVAAAVQQQQQSAALSSACLKVSLHCASALLLSAQHHTSTQVALELAPLDLQQLDLIVRLAPALLGVRGPVAAGGLSTAATPEQVLGIIVTDDRAGGVFKALRHLRAAWPPFRDAVTAHQQQSPLLGLSTGNSPAATLVATTATHRAHIQQQQQLQVPGPELQALLPPLQYHPSPAPPAAHADMPVLHSRKRRHPTDDDAEEGPERQVCSEEVTVPATAQTSC
jgi:hypothetical protein